MGGIFTGPLWFVPFFVITQFWYYALQCAHAFLMKKLPDKYWFWVTLEIMISGILGIVTVLLFGVGKKKILLAITMVPLMKIGSVARENWRKIEIILKKNFLWILLATMSILLIADACGFQIELSKGILGGYDGLLFYPIVFVGIVFCLSLAALIQNLKMQFIFENLGRMSFWVMSLHCMVFKTLDGIAGVILKTESDVLTLFPYSFPELRLIYILLGLFFPMIVGWTCRYLLTPLGKNKESIHKINDI
jgi:fucose 4-O-acetylase-like acetyltransferase